ncbi:MAG: hypothetical protein M1829_002892 [Trizodia sp. TS-e1964]|nr:MAG: hypothetical protein M1829_002892 [Trizodia sp. TS-e1964]
MKFLTSALSASFLLVTLCAGMQAPVPSNGGVPTLFRDLSMKAMQSGHLPETIGLPDSSAAAYSYILFIARLPGQDRATLGFSDWVLLAAKYSKEKTTWRIVRGSPAYILQAEGHGVRSSKSHEVVILVEKFQPVAWVPEGGLEEMIDQLTNVPVNDLSRNGVQGNLAWIESVIEYLRDGKSSFVEENAAESV